MIDMMTTNPEDLQTEATETLQDTDKVAESAEQTPPTDTTAKLQAELAELKDKYLRLYSDFDNFRKRTAKEKLDLISTASEGVLQTLLPIMDDVERAEGIFDSAENNLVEKDGIVLIFNKFKNTLTARGLKPMEAKGVSFDADLHESIAQFPAPSEDLKGKVIDVVEKGYYLNDKVIRFAKVVVGS